MVLPGKRHLLRGVCVSEGLGERPELCLRAPSLSPLKVSCSLQCLSAPSSNPTCSHSTQDSLCLQPSLTLASGPFSAVCLSEGFPVGPLLSTWGMLCAQ